MRQEVAISALKHLALASALAPALALNQVPSTASAQGLAASDRAEPVCLRTVFTARDTPDTRRLRINPYYQVSAAGMWEPKIRIATPPDEPHAEFSFIPGRRPSDSRRARIQLNYYQLPESTDYLDLDFDFSVTQMMSPAMDTDVAFGWLTLFELWNEPGWTDTETPFRISFNLRKRPEQRHLQPLLHGQIKDRKRGGWTSVWETALAFSITPGERYRFHFTGDLGQPGGMLIELEGPQQYVTFVAPRSYLVHPGNPDDTSLWGFNPVKLYTSGAILDRLDESGGRLAVAYYPATVCTGSSEDTGGAQGTSAERVTTGGASRSDGSAQ